MSDLGERSVRFFYTNYRGERSIRTAVPVILTWGQSQWHPRPQWLMTAFDMDKGAERTFALENCQFITCDASDHARIEAADATIRVARDDMGRLLDRGKMVKPAEGQEMCGGYPTEAPSIESDPLLGVMSSLAAAISLLEKGGKDAAPSDKMFRQMLDDYRSSLECARVYLKSAAEGSQ